jgi:sensor domain CHASE-containing protein
MDFIKKNIGFVFTVLLLVLAGYDRFIVLELENQINKKDFERQIQELKTGLKNELKQLDDHEKRIRVLECGGN